MASYLSRESCFVKKSIQSCGSEYTNRLIETRYVSASHPVGSSPAMSAGRPHLLWYIPIRYFNGLDADRGLQPDPGWVEFFSDVPGDVGAGSLDLASWMIYGGDLGSSQLTEALRSRQ